MPSKPAHDIIFYSFPTSGHAHRVELLLRALELPYKRIDVDLGAKIQKQPDFIALNPFGQIPVIDDNGTVIWDSTAILMYLALTYGDDTYLPRDPKFMAEVVAWLGKASGPIMFGPAMARRINVLNNNASKLSSHAIAGDLLTVMDGLLGKQKWLVAHRATIADMAAYAYVAHAPEGDIDLTPYPNVTAWLNRIEDLPFFIPMPRTPVGLWA
jgi:glutathione S-transferase